MAEQEADNPTQKCPYCKSATFEEKENTEADTMGDKSVSNTNGDMTVLCRNDGCLNSLIHSFDVETFLEEPESMICKYFRKDGKCPYQEVGCMFKHEEEEESSDDSDKKDEDLQIENKTERIRHSARSRNRKVNEEKFLRLRDLSISC